MSKVLIVEDEEAIAEIEKDYLELSGFEVTVKSDGESGLESAMGEDYDINSRERSEMLKEVSERLKELQEAGLEVPYKMVLKD